MIRPIAIALTAVAFSAPLLAQTYTVEPRHSHITWAANHWGTSTYRGKFNKTSGTIVLDAANRKGSVEIVVETVGLLSGDERLDKHLKAADFFDVEKHATATFKSNAITYEGDAPKTIEGELTMLGVTRPVTLTVTHFKCQVHRIMKKDYCGADAVATIMRSEWGMKYAIPAVSDEVKLDIAIEAIKN